MDSADWPIGFDGLADWIGGLADWIYQIGGLLKEPKSPHDKVKLTKPKIMFSLLEVRYDKMFEYFPGHKAYDILFGGAVWGACVRVPNFFKYKKGNVPFVFSRAKWRNAMRKAYLHQMQKKTLWGRLGKKCLKGFP